MFVRKTQAALDFVKQWMALCETGTSDQQELNKLCKVTTGHTDTTVIRDNVRIRVFPCKIYNNFYFAKRKCRMLK